MRLHNDGSNNGVLVPATNYFSLLKSMVLEIHRKEYYAKDLIFMSIHLWRYETTLESMRTILP
jgi:hypothetical protein